MTPSLIYVWTVTNCQFFHSQNYNPANSHKMYLVNIQGYFNFNIETRLLASHCTKLLTYGVREKVLWQTT